MNGINNEPNVSNFVHAPAGHYGIIAAGLFSADGEPVGETYNELEADHVATGIYRLTTPYYRPHIKNEHINYIIKATPINPELMKAFEEDKNGEGEFDTDSISQVSIQISDLNDDYIELWITQPVLRHRRSASERSPRLQFETIDKPFMVEISLYGYQNFGEVEGRLDINEATEKEIAELPGIGDALAKRVVEHREKTGSIKTMEDLIDIQGISKTGAKKLQPLISYKGHMEGSEALYSLGALSTLKVVIGYVNKDGDILSGDGFEVNLTNTGRYTINFLTSFQSMPVVLGSSAEDYDHILTVRSISKDSFCVRIHDQSTGNYQKSGFTFIALGNV